MCCRFPHSLSVNKALYSVHKALICFHMKEGLKLSRTSITLCLHILSMSTFLYDFKNGLIAVIRHSLHVTLKIKGAAHKKR